MGTHSFKQNDIQQVTIRVTEVVTRRALPCRISVLDEAYELVDFQLAPSKQLAIRKGVVYTATGEAKIGLPPGRYRVYATRGMQYSLAAGSLEVGERSVDVNLQLEKEVRSEGYVACDPHIHTLTLSGHGDSTLEERLVTLAGEGIDLPVATEHNQNADYSATAKATGVQNWLTTIIGNEVTTPLGHFNAFPIKKGSPPPAFKGPSRKAILDGIRAVPGVKVVTMNHPFDIHEGHRPTDTARFHPLSGESSDGESWDVDAVEVVNSSALTSDYMRPFRDWFALLNHGRQIVGIGSSDSHDVDAYLVGQARTYIASKADHPARIDVEEACTNLLAGRALISHGLLTEMWVEDKFSVGDLATGVGATMRVRVRVQGPQWIAADRLDIYANGAKIASLPIAYRKSAIKLDTTLNIPRPHQDFWLVAIATGPGETQHYWPVRRPYQPTRADWDPVFLGATNPIRVDGDDNGKYDSPLNYATNAVEQAKGDPKKLMELLAGYDSAIAVQAASICRAKGIDLNSKEWRDATERAADQVRQAFVAYRAALPEHK
jgi:hypothetical protein